MRLAGLLMAPLTGCKFAESRICVRHWPKLGLRQKFVVCFYDWRYSWLVVDDTSYRVYWTRLHASHLLVNDSHRGVRKSNSHFVQMSDDATARNEDSCCCCCWWWWWWCCWWCCCIRNSKASLRRSSIKWLQLVGTQTGCCSWLHHSAAQLAHTKSVCPSVGLSVCRTWRWRQRLRNTVTDETCPQPTHKTPTIIAYCYCSHNVLSSDL